MTNANANQDKVGFMEVVLVVSIGLNPCILLLTIKNYSLN